MKPSIKFPTVDTQKHKERLTEEDMRQKSLLTS